MLELQFSNDSTKLKCSDNTGWWPPFISCREVKSLICIKTVLKSSTLLELQFLNDSTKLKCSDNTRWPPFISCREVKSLICIKTVSKSSTLIWNISVYAYWSSTVSSFICYGKNPTDVSALSTLAFYLSSLQALMVSLVKACLLPSLIWHWMKEWMYLHVGWNMLNDMHKRLKLSSNIYPTFHQTCWIKCWIGLTRP